MKARKIYVRLDKYLAETAQCTRSEAKALLSKGRVQVNGAVCKKGTPSSKKADTVAVDGRALSYQQFVYIMLNKPRGRGERFHRQRDTTVVDLVGMLIPGGSCSRRKAGQDQHRLCAADR